MRLRAACRGVLLATSFVSISSFSQTSIPPDSMWSLLDGILKQAAEKKSLEALFGAEPVYSEEQYGAKYLWPRNTSYPDGVQVQHISLITPRVGLYGAVGFEVSGRCVKISEIKSYYPDTWLAAMPTHGYPDAAVTYKAASQGRNISFFINYYSRCLVSVTIRSD